MDNIEERFKEIDALAKELSLSLDEHPVLKMILGRYINPVIALIPDIKVMKRKEKRLLDLARKVPASQNQDRSILLNIRIQALDYCLTYERVFLGFLKALHLPTNLAANKIKMMRQDIRTTNTVSGFIHLFGQLDLNSYLINADERRSPRRPSLPSRPASLRPLPSRKRITPPILGKPIDLGNPYSRETELRKLLDPKNYKNKTGDTYDER